MSHWDTPDAEELSVELARAMLPTAVMSPLPLNRLCGAVALLSVLGTAQVAQAEDYDPWEVQNVHLELGAFAGVMRPSNNHELYDVDAGIEQSSYHLFAADFGARVGFFPHRSIGLEVEGALIPTGVRGSDENALLYRISGSAVLQIPGRLTPFVLVGASGVGVSSSAEAQGDDLDAFFHWGVGGKYYITENFGVRLDVRQLLGPRVREEDPTDDNNISSSFEVLLGVSFAFGRHSGAPGDDDNDGITNPVDVCPQEAGVSPDGCPDKDGDGISNRLDKCPDVKGDREDGCPTDRDGDGVPDTADKCPDKAGTSESGCPDTDGDGVFDDADECVNEAGTLPNGCPDPDPDKDGITGETDKCPTVAGIEPDGCPAGDRDKDGIVDDKDKCPDQAGKGPDGCPLDTDKDGVIDDYDQCVNEPETKNDYKDADGCPDEVPVKVKKFTGAIRGIQFSSGSARVSPRSYELLDNTAKILTEFADLKLEIAGHTDSAGSARFNKRLSQRRADAVLEYLKNKGIDEARLTAVGYGEEQPIASNKTRAGRSQNRRIEFKLN